MLCRLRVFPAACTLLLALRLTGGVARGDTLLAEGKRFRLVGVYPPRKVLKTQKIAPRERSAGVSVSAARGELESFLLILRPRDRKPLLDVRFETNLSAPHLGLQYRRVGYVHIDQPSGVSVFPDVGDRHKAGVVPFGSALKTGYFPDRLLPEDRSEAQPGENTQFWFVLSVALDTKPGMHKGTIRLLMRGIEPVEVPLEVTVHSFVLPRRPTLRNTTWWSPQAIDRARDKTFLKKLYSEMARYRQAADPVLPQPGLNIHDDGSVSVDLDEYGKMAAYCLDELGMSRLFFPRVGGAWYTNLYFLWHAPVVLKQRWYGVRIFGPDYELTPRFRKSFGDYVRQVSDYFRARGWLGRVYMTTMDEPHTADDLKALANFGRFVKSVAPEVRLFCTTYPRPELYGVIDTWCPQQFDETNVRARQAAGDQFMFYKNWLHLIDMPLVDPRLEGWIAWRTRAVGWLTYATMGRWRRAWDEPYAVYPNTGIKAWGLGLWWYPALLKPKVLTSVRWEMMREGAEDYEYLALLARVIDRLSNEHRKEEDVRQARAFLDTVTEGILLYPGVLPAGRDDGWQERPAFTTDNRIVHERREQVARWIEKLQGP